MQLLREAGYRRMPWKNGGGETFEIAVSPADAALDAIDWRISMAVVASDGPFSPFPEVDRTLTILDGEGVRLELAGGGTRVELTRDSAPYRFPADVPTEAWLLGGTVTDLNVMTHRRRYQHQVRRMPVNGSQAIVTTADAVAVFCCAGEVTCTVPGSPAGLLLKRDCALLRQPPVRVELAARQPALVLVLEFYRTTV